MDSDYNITIEQWASIAWHWLQRSRVSQHVLWTAAWKAATPRCVMCTGWVSATVCWVIHVCVLASLCVVLGTSVTVLCKAAWMSATPPRYSPTFLTAVIIGALNFLCCRPVVWIRYRGLYKFWNTLATSTLRSCLYLHFTGTAAPLIPPSVFKPQV